MAISPCIRTWEGFAYLATVAGCCTKKVVGYAMADRMRASLVCEAIDMAVRNCPERKGRLFSIRIGAASTLLGGSPNISRGTAFLPLRAGPGCAGIMPGSSQWAQL